MIAAPVPPPIVNSAFARTQAVKFFKMAVKKEVVRSWKLGKCHRGPGPGVAGCKFSYLQPGKAGLTCTGDLLFRVHRVSLRWSVQAKVLSYRCS